MTYKETKFIVDGNGCKRRVKGLSRFFYYLSSTPDHTARLIDLITDFMKMGASNIRGLLSNKPFLPTLN